MAFRKGGKQGPGRGPQKGAPNAGRPPSALRAQMRGALAERMAVALDIADGKPVQRLKLPTGEETEAHISASPADRLRALEFLAKYGLGSTITATDTEGNDAPTPVQVWRIGDNEIPLG
jgi:hypothetical protein